MVEKLNLTIEAQLKSLEKTLANKIHKKIGELVLSLNGENKNNDILLEKTERITADEKFYTDFLLKYKPTENAFYLSKRKTAKVMFVDYEETGRVITGRDSLPDTDIKEEVLGKLDNEKTTACFIKYWPTIVKELEKRNQTEEQE
jgi:hypothetical protein